MPRCSTGGLIISMLRFPGAASPVEPLPGVAVGPSSGGASPLSGGGASPETGGASAGPLAGDSEKGDSYAQQQDSSAHVQRHHAACCRGADGSGYPLQGSTPQQQ